MDLASLRLRLGEETLCAFRVSNVFLEQSSGGLRWRMQLDDCSASVIGFTKHDGVTPSVPEDGDAYLATVSPRLVDDRIYCSILDIWPMSVAIERINALSLLGRSHCPERAHASLDRLVALGNSLRTPSMRELLGRIMSDINIYPSFLTCRASASYHHADRGGLLTHSVDVAFHCADAASRLSPAARDVTIVAGLLHDIGKLRTVGPGPKRPTEGCWVHHEAVTLEVLAPHMTWLDYEAPKEAAMLRHALTWYSVKGRGFAQFVGADIVRMADQIDVAYNLGKTG